MPNVTEQTYSLSAQTAMSNALIADLVSQGSSGCTLVIFNAADILCATFSLADPPANVDAEGKVIIAASDDSATIVNGGVATYVEFRRANSSVFLSLPVVKSSAASSGRFAMSTTTMINGAEILLTNFEIS